MPEPAPPPKTLRLLNEEVSARAGRLDANTARLDTKATTLLGFILAACTFLATQPIGGWWKVPAYAAFVAAATLGFQSMRPRKFKDAPQPDAVLQFLAQHDRFWTTGDTIMNGSRDRAFAQPEDVWPVQLTTAGADLAEFAAVVVAEVRAWGLNPEPKDSRTVVVVVCG